MLQNIIVYTSILIFGLTSVYYCYTQNLKKSILYLIVAYWILSIGLAYHVRSFNEAKKELENELDRRCG